MATMMPLTSLPPAPKRSVGTRDFGGSAVTLTNICLRSRLSASAGLVIEIIRGAARLPRREALAPRNWPEARETGQIAIPGRYRCYTERSKPRRSRGPTPKHSSPPNV